MSTVGAMSRCLARHGRSAAPAEVNGVEIVPMYAGGVGDAVSEMLRCGGSHVVHFVSAHPTVLARRDPAYRRLLNRGDLNLADGMPVVWTMRMLGRRTDRLTGSDTLGLLAAWGVDRGVRHSFFGGAPGVAEAMRSSLEAAIPGVLVAGVESPPYAWPSADELETTARRVEAEGTDLLWVGLGTPKQDAVAESLAMLGAAPVILTVGAAFDFVSGAKRRPPAWMQRSGLEWFGRLASEPRRLWRRYLIGNAQFLTDVVGDRIRSGMGR